MKILSIVSFVFIVLQQSLYGQVDQSKNYLYLKSDSVIYGENITYNTRYFGSSYFLVDTIKINPIHVKFYQSKSGFYGRSDKMEVNPVFAVRVIQNKINIFKIDTIYSSYRFYPTATGMASSGLVINKQHFYNKGYSDLKKLNYRNLKVDLADNPESSLHLNKCKSVKRNTTILYSAGFALIIGGLGSLIAKTSNVPENTPEPNLKGNFAAMGVGFACCWAGYFVSLSQPKHLINAVKSYNK